MTVTQRQIDIWRVEAQERIRKMYEAWQKDYLDRRMREKDARRPEGPNPTPLY